MSDHTPPEGLPASPPEQPRAGVVAAPPSPSVADGHERKLDPRVVVVWRFGYGIAAAILLFGSLIGVASLFFGAPFPPLLKLLLLVGWTGFAALVALWAVFWPPLRYRHESYRVFDRGIEIRRGVIWRSVIHVPKTRVQHTDVSRGPVERGFGLATLVVFTAGTEHASIGLGGLSESVAFAIRDHLLPEGGDDAV